jgi:hypothetical protein
MTHSLINGRRNYSLGLQCTMGNCIDGALAPTVQLHRWGNCTDFLATSWTSPGPAGPRMRPFDLSGDARPDAIEAPRMPSRHHSFCSLPRPARAVSPRGSRASHLHATLAPGTCTRHLHAAHNSGLRELRNGGCDGATRADCGVSISILERCEFYFLL